MSQLALTEKGVETGHRGAKARRCGSLERLQLLGIKQWSGQARQGLSLPGPGVLAAPHGVGYGHRSL